MRSGFFKAFLIAALVGFVGVIAYLVWQGEPLSAVAVSGVASVFLWFMLQAGKPPGGED